MPHFHVYPVPRCSLHRMEMIGCQQRTVVRQALPLVALIRAETCRTRSAQPEEWQTLKMKYSTSAGWSTCQTWRPLCSCLSKKGVLASHLKQILPSLRDVACTWLGARCSVWAHEVLSYSSNGECPLGLERCLFHAFSILPQTWPHIWIKSFCLTRIERQLSRSSFGFAL